MSALTKRVEDGIPGSPQRRVNLRPSVLKIASRGKVNELETQIGRNELGYNPSTSALVFDIPGAISPTGAEPYLLVIPAPVTGQYNYQLTGTGTGSYTMNIQSVNSSGQSSNAFHATGQITAGSTQTYILTYGTTVYSVYLPMTLK